MNGEFEDNRSYYYLFAKYWIDLWKMGIFSIFCLDYYPSIFILFHNYLI